MAQNPEPVTLSGPTIFRRHQRGSETHCLKHIGGFYYDQSTGELVVTSVVTGRSRRLPFTNRFGLFLLREFDAMMLATQYADRPIESRPKPPRRAKREDRMPDGYQWCYACLGNPDLSPTCEVCDGERILRDDAE